MLTPTPASPAPAPSTRAFETAVHGILVLGEQIVECNDRFARILELSNGEIAGRTLLDLSPDLQADGALSSERWQRRWHAARVGIPQWFAWQFRNRDGRRVHTLVQLAAEEAVYPRLIAHVHDLSQAREAAWTNPASRARLQDVLDHTKAVMFVKDREGRYIFANRELERAARVPARRIIGRTDHEIWPAELADRFRANDAQVIEQRSATEFEVSGTVNGRTKTFISFKFPLFDADGAPYAVCGIATDISDRKRTEQALTSAALAVSSAQGATVFQELVRYLAGILEVEAAIIARPCNREMMHVNAFYLDGELKDNFDYELAGTPCEHVFGKAFRFHPSGAQKEFPNDADLITLGMESYAGYPLYDAAGTAVGLIAVLSRKPMANGEFIESILKLFAVRVAAELEREHSEENLRRSEASYRAIFEASEDAIFVHDWDTGHVIDVNRRACEIYGYSYEEMKRIRTSDVSSGEYPYTVVEAKRLMQQVRDGQTVRVEWHRRNKDGTLHWDDVVLREVVIAGARRIVAFTREITERKQAEQALRQAQKMEALGHLTGGIAHDFNNLLTSIMGYIVLAADQKIAASDPKLAKYLDQARASCTRARDLVQQMLTFSRGQRGQPRPVALPDLVTQAVKLFGASLPSTIEIDADLDHDVPAVMLDPVHLDQILLNLCINARDAMNGVGRIRIQVSRAEAADHLCTACRKHAHGDFVVLRVEDDGEGIEPEILDRIFEPFFTTKDYGKGSGMGLASVHGIVHELGGHILVDSERGRGTRFRVLLPALSDTADESEGTSQALCCPAVPCLRGRILVVDDEQAVGAFMCDLLECWGLQVLVVSSPAEALDRIGREDFDLVITDQMMPRMTGTQLAREVRTLKPDLPVILYTGYGDGISPIDVKTARLNGVLTKPIDPHQLYGLLQTHLPVQTA